jgi:hypothetical protein
MGTLRVGGRLAANKLQLLRELDPAHAWSTPDDRFYCLHCSATHVASAIKIAPATQADGLSRLRCPTRGCEATPTAWALLSPREIVGARPQRVTGSVQPMGAYHGNVAVIQRPLTRNRAPKNSPARENRGRNVGARMKHAVAQSLHRLVIDYRSLLTSLQPGARRTNFYPSA